MNIRFDLGDYVVALNELIVASENQTELPATADIADKIGVVCNILGIAKGTINLYESINVHVAAANGLKFDVFFDAGDADESRVYEFSRVTGDSNSLKYTVMQRIGDDEWTSDELEFINAFVTFLFIVHGRIRVMTLAERLTFYDREMGTYNLLYFMREVNRLVGMGKIGEYDACRFNIKSFSFINDQVGFQKGTEVMTKYARRLQEIVGEQGIVCRIAGDNFVALFKKENHDIVKEFLMGVELATGEETLPEVEICAYTGYYVLPPDTVDPHVIIKNISDAAQIAKNDGYSLFVYFDEKIEKKRDRAKNIGNIFRTAIAKEEFLVYYQPKVNAETGELVGAEALCRWMHEGDLVPPMEFIPVLEKCNDICILDFYMLEHVCRDIKKWIDKGMKAVKVSVNFSRIHLNNKQLAQNIMDVVNKYDIPHELIEIELTETTTDVSFKALKQVVRELHKQGIKTSVDDFGMGYSSLNLIRDLPWNVLKLDKSFLPIDKDEQYKQKKIVLKYVIGMAKSLGMECIAEGAETAEQVKLIKKCGCKLVQGYYFDKPMPQKDFQEKLANNTIYDISKL